MPTWTIAMTCSRRALSAVLALVLAATVLAGCSGASAIAVVRVLEGSATLDGAPVEGDRPAAAGDVVAVADGDAIVEVQWRDGAFTRLAGGTSFTVGTGADGNRGALGTGTAWNTVGPDAGRYAVTTADGAVAASGEAVFALRCADVCDGVTTSGAVTLPGGGVVAAPQTFVVATAATAPATWDAAFGDPFLAANAARDAQAGVGAADAWAGLPATSASLAGTFDGPRTVVSSECTGWAEECARIAASQAATPVPVTFRSDCSVGPPCALTLERTLVGSQGTVRVFSTPLSFDGTAYTGSETLSTGVFCTLPDGSTEGTWTNPATIRVVPTAAEVVDGVYTVTAATLDSDSSVVPVTGTTDPSCAQFEYQSRTVTTRPLQLTQAAVPAASVLPVDVAPPSAIAGPARPSSFSDLKTPAAAIPTLEQGSIILATIIVLVIVLAFPGYLLTRVVADRFEAAAERRAARRRAETPHAGLALVLLVVGTLLAAIIGAAVDPGFGAGIAAAAPDPLAMLDAGLAMTVDPGTWRLIASTLVSFTIFTAGAAIAVRIAGRGIRMRAQFRWGSLLVLLAGVVLSRIAGLNPGIVFGLVAGIVIVDSLSAAKRGRLAFVAAMYAIVVGAVAWTGYAVLSGFVAADPQNALLVATSETLSALTLEAASTLPIALLPIAALDGGALREWRLVAWMTAYAAGLALFIVTIVVVPGSWVEIQGDVVRWVVGFAAFTVVALAVWGTHVLLQRRKQARAAA